MLGVEGLPQRGGDQDKIIFEIVQRKDPGDEPTRLGRFTVPIERPRRNYPIEVTLGYDARGFVNVAARDPATAREFNTGTRNMPACQTVCSTRSPFSTIPHYADNLIDMLGPGRDRHPE